MAHLDQRDRRPPSPRASLEVPLQPSPKLHYLAKHGMLMPLQAALGKLISQQAAEGDSDEGEDGTFDMDSGSESEAGGGGKVPPAVNEVDCRGYTPLMYACEQSKPSYQVVQALMRAKANADIGEPLSGMAPLHYVCHYGHGQVLSVLLSNRANPDVRRRGDGLTPLMITAKHLRAEMAMMLLKAKADPALRSTGDRLSGATALHFACDVGAYPVVDLLCSHPRMPLDVRRDQVSAKVIAQTQRMRCVCFSRVSIQKLNFCVYVARTKARRCTLPLSRAIVLAWLASLTQKPT